MEDDDELVFKLEKSLRVLRNENDALKRQAQLSDNLKSSLVNQFKQLEKEKAKFDVLTQKSETIVSGRLLNDHERKELERLRLLKEERDTAHARFLKRQILTSELERAQLERDRIQLSVELMIRIRTESLQVAKEVIQDLVDRAWDDAMLIAEQRVYNRGVQQKLKQLETWNDIREMMSSVPHREEVIASDEKTTGDSDTEETIPISFDDSCTTYTEDVSPVRHHHHRLKHKSLSRRNSRRRSFNMTTEGGESTVSSHVSTEDAPFLATAQRLRQQIEEALYDDTQDGMVFHKPSSGAPPPNSDHKHHRRFMKV